MSAEKADCEKVEDDGSRAPVQSPTYQYTRDELLEISKSPAAQRRPAVLDKAFYSDDGKWDPERWVRAKFGFRESSPLTLGDGKDRRDLDRDIKRRPSLNDPVERLKENERDGIVLSPQRRSFGTGCHVQQFSRQISLPERERERDDNRGERDRDRDRERDRDRDRDRDRVGPQRKIGSGRITIDRENNRDFSSLRDRYDDRNERDFAWNRDRGPERDRDRDYRDGDWDRDRRFDRGERFRRGGDRDYSDRDRDRRDRYDRGYDRSSRNRHYRHEEKEPEWFTGGPTSQNEIIELRGFEKEGENEYHDTYVHGHKSRSSPAEEKASKDSASEDVAEADGVQSQCSSPEDDQHQPGVISPAERLHKEVPQLQPQQGGPSPTNMGSLFDFEQILKASLPLGEENIQQGSRFSQFFAGPAGGKLGPGDMVNFDELIPQDLLVESRPSPSPTQVQQQQQQYVNYLHHMQLHQQQQFLLQQQQQQQHLHGGLPMPSPAGDNGGTVMDSNKAGLTPSVTALFNSASLGGSNASLSSGGSFSTQDASAQLKAMLLGGPKDSTPSSGTASPSLLPASVQKKVKTVAELEADMHQDSPHTASPSQPDQQGDLTAFNKLLIMLNAGSEANHNAVPPEHVQVGHMSHGMMPGHSEFNHALLRNKEHQMALLQQSMQRGPVPIKGNMHHQLPPHLAQQPPPPLPHAMNAGMGGHIPTPQAMSTPQPHMGKQGIPSSNTADPILSLIQQHPTIVMNPASPAPMPTAGGMVSQHAVVSAAVAAKTGRVPSPLMFSQQPPQHLSAPSPIHPSQLSPHSLTVGTNLAANTISSTSGMRSPVLPRVPSPQELSANAQAVMFNALIKKQLLDQNERYNKKQQERAKSPNPPLPPPQHINVVKPQLAAQPVLPPNPQPKGATLNAFTPTSVLRKMHSDKAEKERQAQESKQEEETEFMPSMAELGNAGTTGPGVPLQDDPHRPIPGPMEDLSDISFLDPVNPNLVSPLEVSCGRSNVLPGGLSQPMSVEEKLKLSKLAEKPGYLFQMLDKSKAAAAAEAAARMSGHGRPIVKGPMSGEPEMPLDPAILQGHQLRGVPPGQPMTGGRPVTGAAPLNPPPQGMEMPGLMIPSSMPMNNAAAVAAAAAANGGRAIVGGSNVQQMGGAEFIRLMEAQRLQQGNMVLPPPPHMHCMGPPPVAMPVGPRIVAGPVHSTALLHQHQMARANALQSQHLRQLMAMHHQGGGGLPPLHTGGLPPQQPPPLSPQTGPLSPAALSATLQRVASPHSTPAANKMNGPTSVNTSMPDMSSGIQRWFSPDILRTQLPSMPPLPTQGSHVMTVDELERN